MESVGGFRHDRRMEILTNIGAAVAGVATVLGGLFALASTFFDDIV